MSTPAPEWPAVPRSGAPVRVARPLPGQLPLVTMALAIGLVLMGLQLWLLTLALDLYLSDQPRGIWVAAAASGGIFAGGLLIVWLLGRRPRLESTSVTTPLR